MDDLLFRTRAQVSGDLGLIPCPDTDFLCGLGEVKYTHCASGPPSVKWELIALPYLTGIL